MTDTFTLAKKHMTPKTLWEDRFAIYAEYLRGEEDYEKWTKNMTSNQKDDQTKRLIKALKKVRKNLPTIMENGILISETGDYLDLTIHLILSDERPGRISPIIRWRRRKAAQLRNLRKRAREAEDKLKECEIENAKVISGENS